ncbi:MAG: hypothetical protein F6K40_14410 [Okeania sp. SIO3I5]|nr:hypothetical protein [Okeania sp. SIO3I5]
MENYTGKYTWVDAPQGNVDKEQCYALDSCDGGLGESGGGCYKWAITADSPRIPWIVCPSIAGMYVDNYGGQHIINCKNWLMGENSDSIFTYTYVGNSSKIIIAENGADNPYFPEKFSQFNWTYSDNALWYCQQVYDADTAEEAVSHETADTSAPSQGGCGIPDNDFPWSKLISQGS